mmetsp:Transcript_4776/g.8802  ORF Transcript_4776/g.8802 Transcript_4776/m.8802 type:complete len:229 (-) Transcript_4776:173-859(-)
MIASIVFKSNLAFLTTLFGSIFSRSCSRSIRSMGGACLLSTNSLSASNASRAWFAASAAAAADIAALLAALTSASAYFLALFASSARVAEVNCASAAASPTASNASVFTLIMMGAALDATAIILSISACLFLSSISFSNSSTFFFITLISSSCLASICSSSNCWFLSISSNFSSTANWVGASTKERAASIFLTVESLASTRDPNACIFASDASVMASEDALTCSHKSS